MAYIGVQPTDTYLSIASQQITGNGGATYTLDYSVSDEESVAVFVNNVRQNVSTYTVSGDQLTLGGTISASDSCWVLFLGRTVGTKTPAVGSVTNDMLAGSIANSKLANSSITLNGSAVSLGGSATVGGSNTPYFSAFINGNVGIASGTQTKMQFNGEEYDSDNAFDSTTNYRFTVPVGSAGKYLIGAQFEIEYVDDAQRLEIKLFKNGSEDQRARNYAYSPANVRELFVQTSALMNLAEGDYVEVYGQHNQGSTRTTYGQHSRFWGFKLI